MLLALYETSEQLMLMYYHVQHLLIRHLGIDAMTFTQPHVRVQNEKLVVDEFLEKVAAASRKVMLLCVIEV